MKIYCICGRWCKSQESLYAHKKYCNYKNINEFTLISLILKLGFAIKWEVLREEAATYIII